MNKGREARDRKRKRSFAEKYELRARLDEVQEQKGLTEPEKELLSQLFINHDNENWFIGLMVKHEHNFLNLQKKGYVKVESDGSEEIGSIDQIQISSKPDYFGSFMDFNEALELLEGCPCCVEGVEDKRSEFYFLGYKFCPFCGRCLMGD